MAIDERVASLEAEVTRLKAKPKDIWDKIAVLAAILVPVAIAVAGNQFAQNMKRAEIASAESREQQQQVVALMNARVSQADVLAHFLDALTGTNEVKQRVAIRAVLIALPVDGPSLVKELTAPSGNAATKVVASEALTDRVQTLVAQLFDPVASSRTSAYDQLTSPAWRTNPDTITPLITYARSHVDNDNGVYNTVVTLKDLSRSITQPRKQDINAFCAEISKERPRILQQCNSLSAWLETKR